jgi:hypothetical protein
LDRIRSSSCTSFSSLYKRDILFIFLFISFKRKNDCASLSSGGRWTEFAPVRALPVPACTNVIFFLKKNMYMDLLQFLHVLFHTVQIWIVVYFLKKKWISAHSLPACTNVVGATRLSAYDSLQWNVFSH